MKTARSTMMRTVRHAAGILLRTRDPGLTMMLLRYGSQGRAVSHGVPLLPEVQHVLGTEPDELRAYLLEVTHDHDFLSHIDQAVAHAEDALHRAGLHGAVGGFQHGPLLYALTRWLRPAVAVETGVAAGISSAYILAAMERTGSGMLHSIDLPHAAARDPAYLELQRRMFGAPYPTQIPPGRGSGYAVPDALRERWHLIEADARSELPGLLVRLGRIDMFLHDSMHTYDQMSFEYTAAHAHLRPGGLLLSDDVSWNTAFDDFARRRNARYSLLRGQLGVMIIT